MFREQHTDLVIAGQEPERKLMSWGENPRDFTLLWQALASHSQFLSKGRNLIKTVFDFKIYPTTYVG